MEEEKKPSVTSEDKESTKKPAAAKSTAAKPAAAKTTAAKPTATKSTAAKTAATKSTAAKPAAAKSTAAKTTAAKTTAAKSTAAKAVELKEAEADKSKVEEAVQQQVVASQDDANVNGGVEVNAAVSAEATAQSEKTKTQEKAEPTEAVADNAASAQKSETESAEPAEIGAAAVAADTANADKKGQKDLGDISRVKVISPGRLVVKRFMRNRLAIIGACILVFMFLFAFLGPVFSPYGEDQTFRKYEYLSAAFMNGSKATVANFYGESADLTVGSSEGTTLTQNLNEMTDGETRTIVIDEKTFGLRRVDDMIGAVDVSQLVTESVASYSMIRNQIVDFNIESDYAGVEGLENAIRANTTEGTFDYNGITYNVTRSGRNYRVTTQVQQPPRHGVLTFYNVYFNELRNSDLEEITPDFSLNNNVAVKKTVIDGLISGSFEYSEDGTSATYTVDPDDDRVQDGDVIFKSQDGEDFAFVSNKRVVTSNGTNEVFFDVTINYVKAIHHMEDNGLNAYTLISDIVVLSDASGKFELIKDAEIDLSWDQVSQSYTSLAEVNRMLLDIDAAPGKEHWLGTDGNGMDNLTRMMYGGRVSLMVGFIVIIIEVVIGVLMGGIAGYFGGWVDMLIMRIVDIFNCIPFLPVMIILGSVFDSVQLNPWLRIVYMMMIMGFVSWTGVARLVRGQILSLREQEFMQAAEATGISVPRRIFKHLVPNVMPQLIVSATMGLGDVIIMESTLSFLGLGCKYPMSSWGTIINSVNTQFGLINFAYVWIPVGILISLTVIAFNFVGDGLRDAFDPKMKR